jgi:hypothetical protein
MITYHLTVDYVSVHWFVLWCLFWVFLGLYVSYNERD